MKKHLLFAIVLTFCLVTLQTLTCFAQNQTELWGMTYQGGSGGGLIIKTDGNGNNYEVVKSFIDYPGKNPYYTELCQASNGNLYGMTYQGGANNMGVLFEYDPATDTYTKKLDFTGPINGSNPRGSLMQATNGKLYGMTYQGGSNNMGVLFEYDPATNNYTKKLDFAGATNGSYPQGSLMQATNGQLYGMTYGGGANGWGVLFEYDPVTNTYTKKLDFAGATTGSNPQGSLMQATNGKLYGMTYGGGVNNLGVLFEYDPATNNYTKELDFAGVTSGSNPQGSLMQATNGQLYGMTYIGGLYNMGVLFEYDPSTNTYTKKLNFEGTITGRNPHGSLIQATNSKLYGMTSGGGINYMGTLFEYDPATNTYTKKLNFAGATNGNYPYGSLMQATNGQLYGMTYGGGANNIGVLFEYDPATSTYTKKLDFAGTINERNPCGSLIQSTNNKLYGMTSQGGATDMGVLFEYDPAINIYSKKLDFAGPTNGSNPYGSLMQSSNGNLYGMTYGGGATDMGVLFEYDPATNIYSKKLDFAGATNGSNPYGYLMQASNGKLYAMTNYGGVNNMGVLFEYDPATSTYTKKLDFAGATNGSNPHGSLMQAMNGKLYGMTNSGGINNIGILFEYDPATNTYTKKLDFAGASNGSNPYGSLMQASNGKLYGMTNSGGTNSMGVLFEYDPATDTYTKKLDFAGATNGSNPHGSLMQATNGKLYGMTNSGGTNSMGVLFEYDPATNTYTKKLDFNAINGKNPLYNDLIEICVQPKSLAVIPNVTICAGANTNLVTSATGNGLTYQWQVDNGGGFTNLSNNSTYADVTDDTLHITGATIGMNGYQYRCNITSTCPVKTIPSDTAMLTVNPVYAYTENHSMCDGETYNWHGADYTTANTYTANYTSINGCDSIYTLNLTVNPVYAFTETHSMCDGETYNWHGTDYTTANTYTANYSSINGCDSIYTLNLTVNPVYAFNETHSICSGQTYVWHGQNLTTANTYTANYSSINGCDSIYTLNLTVNPVYAYTENHSICDGETYNWHGADYTTANTYTANYSSINGCDSIYTLNLTVNSVYAIAENHNLCKHDVYNWQGTDYTTAGTYTASYTSINGCDSIYTLDLTVDSVDIGVTLTNVTITADSTADAYQWLDCNNGYAPIGGANSQSYTATANGNYAVLITQGLCSDTSACVAVATIGIATQSTTGLSIYPNPATNQITISSASNEQTFVSIYDVQNKLMMQTQFLSSKQIDVSKLAKGIYLVRIQSQSKELNTKLVIQ